MEKILLINSPNRKSEPPRHYPYGIALITSILEKEGYSVDAFDGNFKTNDELKSQLISNNYDFIGISGLITTYNYQKEVSNIIKKYSANSILASGGGLASAVDTELLKLIPELDVIFIGEGEISVVDFMRNQGNPLNVRGISYRDGSRIIKNENSDFIQDLNKIPYPNLDKWELEKYFDNKSFPLTPNTKSAQRRGNILTTRGCAYKCDFCFNSLGRHKIRSRTVDNVIGEIDELINKHDIDFISFMDEEFLINKKLVEGITEQILSKGYKFQWGIAARSTSVNEDNLKLIKKAGCDFIYYGFDSGSPETLIQMNKRMTIEDNIYAFRKSVEAKIYPVPNIIIGYDNESLKNISENYDFFHQLIQYGRTLKKEDEKNVFERGFNNFGAIYFATPYPGSQLYNRNKSKLPSIGNILSRVSSKDAYELTVNVSNISDEVLIEEQQKMIKFVRGFRL